MKKVRIHLGCGKRVMPGFVHIDLADYGHIDYRHDVRTLPMFKDATVSLIYASHIVEHFNADEVVRILQEWRRVLKKGGLLRLAVPDFEALVRVYTKYKNLALIRGPLYGKQEAFDADKSFCHKMAYNFSSLKTVLEEAGFINIKRWDWREVFVGEYEGFDDFSQAYIPHMNKETGILISLNVEADK